MHEQASALLSLHEKAISELDNWPLLSKAKRLSRSELESQYRGRHFVAGWRLCAEFSAGLRRLDVLATVQFPFALPRVALVDRPQFLTWPHIERDGLLCLVSDASTADHNAYIGQVKDLLGDAHSLITASMAGTNGEDFRHEFHSYWSCEAEAEHIPFLSLISPRPPSRSVVVWRGRAQFILAEDEKALLEWMKNRFEGSDKPREVDSAAFVWLLDPLVPRDYPKTSRDVWELARKHSREGLKILQQLAAQSPPKIVVMLGATGEHGPVLAGVTIRPPELSLNGQSVSTLDRGFRPGRTPLSLLVNRYSGSTVGVNRAEVSRADAAWIHGRGKDLRQPQLSGMTVVVIGCGSLGAPVAIQLAMGGVGKLIMIDPDKLKYGNVGRHPLGAEHVGEYKSQALTAKLRASYPHSTFEFWKADWRKVFADEPGVFGRASLVVSATGDWGAEDALNTWQLDQNTVPVVYGWMEPHACAGHAVGVMPNRSGGCLACGFSEVGKPLMRATDWPEETLRQEPACGAIYQPYGPAELAYSVNLVTELVLDVLLGRETESVHRIWACRLPVLNSNGGSWTAEWGLLKDSRSEGGCISARAWPRNPQCLACNESV